MLIVFSLILSATDSTSFITRYTLANIMMITSWRQDIVPPWSSRYLTAWYCCSNKCSNYVCSSMWIVCQCCNTVVIAANCQRSMTVQSRLVIWLSTSLTRVFSALGMRWRPTLSITSSTSTSCWRQISWQRCTLIMSQQRYCNINFN